MPRRGPHHANITWLPHVRLAWGGTLGNTAEVWTNSIRYLPTTNTVITPAQATQIMQAAQGALTAWMGAGTATKGAEISKDVKLNWVKANSINGDGLQYSGDTNVLEFTPVIGGGGESNFVPFDQTFAISLLTALKRGRSHIGRIYPPCVNAPIIFGTGMQDALNAAAQAAAFTWAMHDMKLGFTDGGIPGGFAVFSPGDSLKSTVPLATLITGCTVDTRPDTQRRRLNRLKGVRSAVTAIF